MKRLLCSVLVCFSSISTHGQVSHTVWDGLLKKHVSADGWVSYKGFLKDSTILNQYLGQLSSEPPTEKWSENEKLSFWINAYNAFTIKLVIDNYPLESIKDIKRGIPFVNSVWDIEFFKIGGEKMTLNKIEHSILRKQFDEPRIHFAIVCASKSCPKLLNEAYVAIRLEDQLQTQALDFLNDKSKNQLSKEEFKLSAIFNWFKGDFTENSTLEAYVSALAGIESRSKVRVSYLEYDWSLNGE